MNEFSDLSFGTRPTKIRRKPAGKGWLLGLVVAVGVLRVLGVCLLIGATNGAPNNARCPHCNKEWRISEQYRGNMSEMYKTINCPRCDQPAAAGVLYQEYEEAHGKKK